MSRCESAPKLARRETYVSRVIQKAVMTIAGQEEGTVEVGMIGRSHEQSSGSDSKRGADHAADQQFQAALASALGQQQGLGQPARFVQLYVDRIVPVHEAR
jgi:hypothetical protein